MVWPATSGAPADILYSRESAHHSVPLTPTVTQLRPQTIPDLLCDQPALRPLAPFNAPDMITLSR